MTGILSLILFPFSILYYLVTRFRNHLYDIGYKKSFEFEVNTINVGNLSVGGTGKTPMIEYLIELLVGEYKLATLSRGYGRKTKGFKLADQGDDASTLGDEPFQFYKKYGKVVSVAVGEERAMAIPQILHEVEETDVILLDDAYQHRMVKPNFNILLSNYQRPFYTDWILPSGRLREPRNGAKRAQAVVITKCPRGISNDEMQAVRNRVSKYSASSTPVFFTRIAYGEPKSFFADSDFAFSKNVILLTGIANPGIMKDYVEKEYNLVKHWSFSDHHRFTKEDIQKVLQSVKAVREGNACVLTTEKDMMRLLNKSHADLIKDQPLFYLPIRTEFIDNKEAFDKLIFDAIEEKKKNIEES